MQYMHGVQKRGERGVQRSGFCRDRQIRLDFYLLLMYTAMNYFGRPFPTRVIVV